MAEYAVGTKFRERVPDEEDGGHFHILLEVVAQPNRAISVWRKERGVDAEARVGRVIWKMYDIQGHPMSQLVPVRRECDEREVMSWVELGWATVEPTEE